MRNEVLKWRSAVVLALCLGTHVAASAQSHGCPSLRFDGEVEAGKSFTHPIDAAHTFLLEALPSGWIVRVLPTHSPRPPHDYAELATPPYRSPSPLLLSTDFAFRAQDAIAWNPREFHFFTTPRQVAEATAAYNATIREPNRPAAGAALYPLLAEACRGELRILDAKIAGGTNDQSPMAAAVASHFAETAHTVETSAPPTPLGKILRLRFRVLFGDSRNPARP